MELSIVQAKRPLSARDHYQVDVFFLHLYLTGDLDPEQDRQLDVPYYDVILPRPHLLEGLPPRDGDVDLVLLGFEEELKWGGDRFVVVHLQIHFPTRVLFPRMLFLVKWLFKIKFFVLIVLI
jgi:hypothetical protein